MKTLGAAVLTSLALLPVRWQPGVTATNDPKTETVVDASGNLRVPGNYRTAYQSGNPRGSEVVMLQPRGRARGTIAGTYRFHSGGEERFSIVGGEERFCDQWLAVSKISSTNAESNRGRISL